MQKYKNDDLKPEPILLSYMLMTSFDLKSSQMTHFK